MQYVEKLEAGFVKQENPRQVAAKESLIIDSRVSTPAVSVPKFPMQFLGTNRGVISLQFTAGADLKGKYSLFNAD